MEIKIFLLVAFYNLFQIISSFIVGYLILLPFKLKRVNSFLDVFIRIIIGIVTIVFVFAVLKTHGRTIMLPALIPVLLLIKGYQKEYLSKIEQNQYSVLKLILTVFCTALFFSGIAFHTYDIKNDFFALPHPDYLFYGKVSAYIWNTGIESSIIDYVNPLENKPIRYHYFELWLNAIYSNLFKTNTVQYLMTVTYPFFFSLVFIGFLCLYERLIKSNLKFILLLSFFSIFTSGVFFNWFQNISLLSDSKLFSLNSLSYYKLSIIYTFLFISILGFKEHKKNYLYILSGVLFLGILYIPVMPAVFMGYCIFIGLSVLRNKKLLNKQFLLINLLIFIVAVFIFLFYTSFNKSNDTSSFQIDLLSYLKTSINIFGGGLLMTIIIYFIYIPFALWNIWKSKDFDYLFFIISIIASGLFCWAAIHHLNDAVQLYSNIAVSLLNISLAYNLSFFIINKRASLVKQSLIVLFWGVFIFNNINEVISKRVEVNIDKNRTNIINRIKQLNPNGVSIKSSKDYSSIFSKNENFSVLASYLVFIDPKYHPISLSVFDIPITNAKDEKAVKKAIFYKYVMRKKEHNEFTTIEQAQLDFIKEYHIEYLITTDKVQLNDQLKQLVKEELIDEKSKLHFYILQ